MGTTFSIRVYLFHVGIYLSYLGISFSLGYISVYIFYLGYTFFIMVHLAAFFTMRRRVQDTRVKDQRWLQFVENHGQLPICLGDILTTLLYTWGSISLTAQSK